MKLVKFALTLPLVAISVFLLAALSAQAEYVWTGNGVDGEGNPTNDWNVSGNWELARTVTDKSTYVIPEGADVTASITKATSMNRLTIEEGASLHLAGTGTNFVFCPTQQTFGPNCRFILDHANYTRAGIHTLAEGMTLCLTNGAFFSTRNSATQNMNVNIGVNGKILLYGASVAKITPIFKSGSEMHLYEKSYIEWQPNGSPNLSNGNNKLVLASGAWLDIPGTLTTGDGSVVTIDEAMLFVRGQVKFGQSGAAGDRFVFKGDNPQFIAYNSVTMGNSATRVNGLNLEFEVPESGFVDVPFQTMQTSVMLSGISTLTSIAPWCHITVLPTSGAVSAGTRTTCPLVQSAGGMQRKSPNVFDFNVSGSACTDADFVFAELGGTEATENASSQLIVAGVGSGDPAPPRPEKVLYSTGVSTFSAVAVDGATITLSSTITKLSTEGETQVRWMNGTAPDALTCYKTEKVTEKGPIVQDYVESVFGQTYYVQVLLDTLDANGAIVHTESSLVQSALTVDDATYTWRDVDGDWTGDWNDPRHWTADKDGDRAGYPATADTSAVFPGGHAIVVRMDAPHTVTALNLSAADIDVTFVNQPNVTKAENAITMAGTNKTPNFSGNNGRIVFRGVSVKNVRAHFSIGTGKTVRFENADLSSNMAFSEGGAGSWLEVTEGSVVSLGTSPFNISGGGDYSGGVMISNATLSASYWGMPKDSRMVIRFAGKTPLLTVGKSGIYPEGANSRVRLEFCIPEGGYDASVIQPTTGVTWTNPLFTTTGSGVFLFWVDPASPALSTFGDYRLLTGAGKGIAAEKVVFDDAKVIGKARISGLFGTAESDPYEWSPISKFVGTPASVGARLAPPPGFQILVQ